LRLITTQVFNENLPTEATRIVTGDAHVKPFREIHRGASFVSFLAGTSLPPAPRIAPNRRTIACPVQRARRPQATTGTTASIAPPSASAVQPRRERQDRARRATGTSLRLRKPHSSAVATNPLRAAEPLVPKSIADARAELTGPQMRIEQEHQR